MEEGCYNTKEVNNIFYQIDSVTGVEFTTTKYRGETTNNYYLHRSYYEQDTSVIYPYKVKTDFYHNYNGEWELDFSLDLKRMFDMEKGYFICERMSFALEEWSNCEWLEYDLYPLTEGDLSEMVYVSGEATCGYGWGQYSSNDQFMDTIVIHQSTR